MWYIDNIDIRETTLETGHDLFGSIITKAVYIEDICLINAISRCDFSEDPAQFLVCHCGISGCASGGWISIRRIDNQVLLIPDIASLASDDEFERDHYAPPDYLMTSSDVGAVLSESAYQSIKAACSEFPEVSDIKPLALSEAIQIIQLQAPFQILGHFPNQPRINHDFILAVTEGDTNSEIRAVNSFIEFAQTSKEYLQAAAPTQDWSPIEFHIDGPGYPAWTRFVRSQDALAVVFPHLGPLVMQCGSGFVNGPIE